MASREKKLSTNRKQSISSPLPPKEDITNNETKQSTPIEAIESTPSNVKNTATTKSPSTKKMGNRKATQKTLIKKSNGIKLKPARKNVKLKQKMITAMLTGTKTVESKKKLMKTNVRSKTLKLLKKMEESLPDVFDSNDESICKQSKKKPKADKANNSDGENLTVDPAKTKRVYRRKPKVDYSRSINQTIDEVISDLSAAIKESEMSNGSKDLCENTKKKKGKILEKTFEPFSPSQRKVIDMLDLNVVNQLKELPLVKRRHSIEKFPVSFFESDKPRIGKLVALNQLRSRGLRKIRRSPYKTRSDSPARRLRNGKQRKDIDLLEGVAGHRRRKRKRNCSDFSGSEISKLSGYESDSSFSDLSSVHGAENNDLKETEKKPDLDHIKLEQKLVNDGEIDCHLTDSNSNLCLTNDERITCDQIKTEDDIMESTVVSPSLKVPEKSIILDKMKQTFNDTFDDKDAKKCSIPKTDSVKIPDDLTEIKKETEIVEVTEKAAEDETSVAKLCSEPESPTDEQTCLRMDVEDTNGIVETQTNAINGELTQDDLTIKETPEDLKIKENILQALGLQSAKAAQEARLNNKNKLEQYTGTLKTVIKINRNEKKRSRNHMKMILHKSRSKLLQDQNGMEQLKDVGLSNWKHSGQSSDTAGAHRKSHYSNRSNMDGSSEHTSDGETTNKDGTTKALVIPEKASSFSIHPGRICKDECSYCFGKFGLFDTPCHIAQMKSVERQNKILSTEKHLTTDSCLCDACYRHVDRKANTPSYINKSFKRNAAVAPGPREDHCHVLGCHRYASNILRRKWIIKMRKSICEVINIDLDNPGLHSIPICEEHYSALEYLMVCAMCKRRLAKNHIHYLGPEIADLNLALAAEEISINLADKPVVCKLCKYFAAIILKSLDERPENSSNFFLEYKKRLLHFNDIVPMDEAAAEEPIVIPTKDTKIEKEQFRKKRRLLKNPLAIVEHVTDSVNVCEKSDQNRVPSNESTNQSRPESPSDYMVDYNTLIPSIAMDCSSDSDSRKELTQVTQPRKLPRPETVKQAVEISKTMKLKNDKSSDIAVQRLGSNPSISVRQLFPAEEDLPLQGHIDFGNVKERTPEGWEKCTSIIQYDLETKMLWQELQKPYGNQSSFLKHLILLEKYFRNGDLILSTNASHHSVNYSESVHNRLRAYDNIPSSAGNVQPISMIPFNKPQKSNSGIITSIATSTPKENQIVLTPCSTALKSTPITISQLNSPPLIPTPITSKPKTVGALPGLISLQPGTNKPAAPVMSSTKSASIPQSQKIKFPITKNWRPNLIPIDPSKKSTERKAGFVQVISEGKPYHITLEDYKKMCAIKKSFELKQKRRLEASQAAKSVKVYNSVLKNMAPNKGLLIAKTSPKNDSSNESEVILEKLDKQIEKLGNRLSENKPPLGLPKIPKSLTVIPQTVPRKPSRPSSPVLLITPKPKQVVNKS